MGRSRSPDYRRRSRSGSPPRRGYSPRRSRNDERISLLVRNIGDRCPSDELRRVCERYGIVKDIYIPQDYYTKRSKPFAFVEFINYDDARACKEDMDRRDFMGRQIDVVFAQQRRKSADQMRQRDDRGGYGRGRDSYYDRRDVRRSPSPRRSRSRSRSPPRRRGGSRSRSRSPRGDSPRKDSPPRKDPPRRERDDSPRRSRSPAKSRSASPKQSPKRDAGKDAGSDKE